MAVGGMTHDPIVMPAPVAGRYVATEAYCEGTCMSSYIWRGVDLDDGADVILKAYTTLNGQVRERALYENEVAVQRRLIDSPRLAKMLAHDDERAIVVKEFVEGLTVQQTPALPRDHVRAVTRLQVGIWLDQHELGLRGNHGADEDNVVVVPGGARSIEVCNASSGGWGGDLGPFIATAVRLLGGAAAVRTRATTLAHEGRGLAMVVARLDVLRDLDPDLAAALEGNAGDLRAMLTAVERLM